MGLLSSGRFPAIILRQIPTDPVSVLLLVPGGVLFALNIALNSRTKRIKKTTDVKEDTKQVKKGMRRVGQDAEGKKIRNSWKYKKKTPVLALPDCNK